MLNKEGLWQTVCSDKRTSIMELAFKFRIVSGEFPDQYLSETVFTKAMRNVKVIGSPSRLKSSVMAVLQDKDNSK